MRHALLLSYIIFGFGGCFSPKYLHPSDVLSREVRVERRIDGRYCLRIKGVCGHSALGVKKIEISISDNVLLIRFPLKCGGEGRIKEYVEIPSGITNILWEGVSVWNSDVRDSDNKGSME